MYLSEIAEITKGKLINLQKDRKIDRFVIDSRKVKENSFFVPLKGKNFDGHQFIEDSLKNGAVGYFCERHIRNRNGILVDNSLESLKEIGKYKRKKLSKVIGITGTSGKTTTKELLNLVLSQFNSVYATEGNYNNEIGVPLTLSNIPENAEIGVFELGASKKGDIENLSSIVEQDISVLTTVGHGHSEKFGTFQDIVEGKGEIFLNHKFAVLPEFFLPFYESMLTDYITFGTTADADIQILNVEITDEGTEGIIKFKKDKIKIKVPIFHKNIFESISAVSGVLYGLDLNPISSLKIIEEKFQGIEGRVKNFKKKNLTIIDDTYNANPVSVKNAIHTLNQLNGKKVLVLGDMLELGKYSKKLHRELGEEILNTEIENVFLYGDETKEIYEVLKEKRNVKLFENKEKILDEILKLSNGTQMFIWVKGSRSMKMEEVVNNILEG
jgi:UDP-N-acetylmuramoyl-tripeptide--D-alanyl-D-alanine ligase